MPPSPPDALLARMGSLADPTRLRLLRLLEKHELGVVELCDVLQLPQSTVSRHLKTLGDQDWLRSRRRGTAHLYQVVIDELDPPARRLWELAREGTDGWATAGQDRLRLERVLAERRDETQSFFAGKAGEWDRLRAEFYGTSFSAAAVAALLPADYVVADLGCGTGTTAAELAPLVGRVVGVDGSADMLRAAGERCAAFDNVELHKGDLAALPLEPASVDAALLVLALSYAADPAAAVGEMARILRPGGRAVVVDLLPHDDDHFRRQMGQRVMGFSTERIAAMLSSGGLTVGSVRPLPPEPTAKGPALFVAWASRPSPV